jgi:hypothetical protein
MPPPVDGLPTGRPAGHQRHRVGKIDFARLDGLSTRAESRERRGGWMQSVWMQAQKRLALVRPRRTSVLITRMIPPGLCCGCVAFTGRLFGHVLTEPNPSD